MTDQILVRLPAYFYTDHLDRLLPTPSEVKSTKRNVWISLNDPCTAELLSDAEYYAGPGGPDNCSKGLIASARATMRAIHAALDASASTLDSRVKKKKK
jgi:hypothetical protein